jgi:multiple sugar transport system substrate-binding protein
MKHRKLVAMAGVVAVALPFVASFPATAATKKKAAAKKTKSVELRWRTRPDNQAEIDVYSTISKAVDTKLADITLKYEAGTSEGSPYQDKLRTEIAAGTAPDVFWIPGTDIADFAKKGLIQDVRSYAAKTKGYSDKNYYAGPMASLTYNPAKKDQSSLWGIPRDVSAFAMYLNLDLIAKAGAPDPRQLAKNGKWDWAAMRDVAKKVTETGAASKGLGLASWWANYGYFMNAAGGGFFTADRNACAADSAGSVQGLQFLSDLVNVDKTTVAWGEDPEKPFNAGNVGMFINGRWATPGARENLKFNWDVVKLPDGPGGPSNWLFWGAYVVNAKTKNPAQAWALVDALTQDDVQASIAKLGANIPSRQTAAAKANFLTYTPPANNQAFIDGISEKPVAEGPLWNGDWPGYDKVLNDSVTAVLTGKKSIADYKSTICKDQAKNFG